MIDKLLQNWSDDERWTPELAANVLTAQEAMSGGWYPTEHIRFVERGVPARFILQQLWLAISPNTGQSLDFAEWRDVPSVKETPHA